MNQAGPVLTAVFGLWIAYLVPHRLRYRQQLLDARSDDRFSAGLRVVRVGGPTATGTAQVREVPAERRGVRLHPDRPATLPRGARGARRGGIPMDRPHGTSDRVLADAVRHSASEHARRAAHLASRAAGARRRAALTALLLVASVGGWAATIAVPGLSVLLGAAPTVLLAGVLVLGRRAVVAGARADAAWAAGAATRLPVPVSGRTPVAVGRAVHPSEATTEVMARVPARTTTVPGATALADAAARLAQDRHDAHRSATGRSSGTATDGDTSQQRSTPVRTRAAREQEAPGDTWAPVPVPRPSYTLKPSARRAEPAPLVLDETRHAEATATTDDRTDAQRDTDEARETTSAPRTGSLDLDAVLARRRAAGE